jgi:heterodisulfide reductase subunit B
VLGAKLIELEDWNCCGATAYMGIRELTAFTISARNLALAEQKGGEIITPCSGCYVGLSKTNNYIKEFPDVKEKVNAALGEGGLKYNGTIRVRHLLDMFTHDIGPEKIKQFVVKPLHGLKVGCYYGCQIVRPRNEIDDPECPETMEILLKACGAAPIDFALKAFCCGGALMGTEEPIGLRLVKNILHSATRSGIEILVTPCPLCQLNVDAYQARAAKKFNMKFNVPILYFTQLIGLALGIEPKKLGIGREIVSANKVLKQFL